jgi:hypothetical protein
MPTHLNSKPAEKLRELSWLISAKVVEISQLRETAFGSGL